MQARTIGGAVVTVITTEDTADRKHRTTATCGGCTASDSWGGVLHYNAKDAAESKHTALHKATSWVNTHAGICRFEERPESAVPITALDEGDTIAPGTHPICCDTPMTSNVGPDATVWDCAYGDSQIHTRPDGVVSEPPAIRCG